MTRFAQAAWAAAVVAAMGMLGACGGDPPPPANGATAVPTTTPARPVTSTTTTASAPEGVASLLSRANAAFAANRLVAPAGDNAFEMFVAVQRAEPGNAPAREALIELFPFAITATKRAIAANDVGEAERILALFEEANPSSLAASELRAALATQRARTAAPETRAPATIETSRDLPALATSSASPAPTPSPPRTDAASTTTTADAGRSTPAATAPPNSATPALAKSPDARATPAPARDAAVPPAASTAVAAPAPTVAAPATNVTTASYAEPIVVARVNPEYPAVARQRRMQGFVEVEFTVGVDGTVSDARVVRAEPSRVFDNAALRAVSRWKFRPATRDGQPTVAKSRQRLTFRPS